MRNKKIALLFATTCILGACNTQNRDSTSKSESSIAQSQWLNRDFDLSQIRNVVNTYNIIDSTDQKIGSMVFSFRKVGDLLIAKDTSQFDNGSIYETAILEADLKTMAFKNIDMEIKVPGREISIDLKSESNSINGRVLVMKDTIAITNMAIDSVYSYDIFREEIYMLLHAIDLKKGDSIPFKMFVSNSLKSIDASLNVEQSEIIEVPAGKFETTVVYLNTGGLLDNRIWISNGENKRIVKFYVPTGNLNIDLISNEKMP